MHSITPPPPPPPSQMYTVGGNCKLEVRNNKWATARVSWYYFFFSFGCFCVCVVVCQDMAQVNVTIKIKIKDGTYERSLLFTLAFSRAVPLRLTVTSKSQHVTHTQKIEWRTHTKEHRQNDTQSTQIVNLLRQISLTFSSSFLECPQSCWWLFCHFRWCSQSPHVSSGHKS